MTSKSVLVVFGQVPPHGPASPDQTPGAFSQPWFPPFAPFPFHVTVSGRPLKLPSAPSALQLLSAYTDVCFLILTTLSNIYKRSKERLSKTPRMLGDQSEP